VLVGHPRGDPERGGAGEGRRAGATGAIGAEVAARPEPQRGHEPQLDHRAVEVVGAVRAAEQDHADPRDREPQAAERDRPQRQVRAAPPRRPPAQAEHGDREREREERQRRGDRREPGQLVAEIGRPLADPRVGVGVLVDAVADHPRQRERLGAGVHRDVPGVVRERLVRDHHADVDGGRREVDHEQRAQHAAAGRSGASAGGIGGRSRAHHRVCIAYHTTSVPCSTTPVLRYSDSTPRAGSAWSSSGRGRSVQCTRSGLVAR